jgi:hypothetical protein
MPMKAKHVDRALCLPSANKITSNHHVSTEKTYSIKSKIIKLFLTFKIVNIYQCYNISLLLLGSGQSIVIVPAP